MRDFLVSEEFTAPQGEGRNAGRMSYWVRLSTCNLHCSWCDSSYTWAFSDRQASFHESGKVYDPKTEIRRVSVQDMAARIRRSGPGMVTFTGGEPLLQMDPLAALLDEMAGEFLVDFETAGSVAPSSLALYPVQFTVSPKLGSSGNPVELRRHPEAVRDFLLLDSVFKFVIDTRTAPVMAADLREAAYLVLEWGIPARRVWLSPCGTTAGEVISGMKMLEPACREMGWNLSSRLQVLMHGNERGF